MRAFLLLAVAAAVVAAAIGVVVRDGAAPATASHGNFNVHVHDDYFHPTGSFVPGPGHVTAKALCEQNNPDTTCTSVIHVAPGDSITWISPVPLAANQHTVTECTDGTFTVCGPAVAPSSPIDDSGVRAPANPGPSGFPYGPVSFANPGYYYYRCEIHPGVMKGIVQVIANNAPPQGGVGGITGLLGDEPPASRSENGGDGEGIALAVLAFAGTLVVLGTLGATALVRARSRGRQN